MAELVEAKTVFLSEHTALLVIFWNGTDTSLNVDWRIPCLFYASQEKQQGKWN
jgi:hypothetical protein